MTSDRISLIFDLSVIYLSFQTGKLVIILPPMLTVLF